MNKSGKIRVLVPDDFDYQQFSLLKQEKVKKAYICSPCRGDSLAETYQNIAAARYYQFQAYMAFNCVARALHAYVLFDDSIPVERSYALSIGRDILSLSDMLLVCGKRITSGMRTEIAYAATLGVPVYVFSQDIYLDVLKIITRNNGPKELAHYYENPFLAYDPGELGPAA